MLSVKVKREPQPWPPVANELFRRKEFNHVIQQGKLNTTLMDPVSCVDCPLISDSWNIIYVPKSSLTQKTYKNLDLQINVLRLFHQLSSLFDDSHQEWTLHHDPARDFLSLSLAQCCCAQDKCLIFLLTIAPFQFRVPTMMWMSVRIAGGATVTAPPVFISRGWCWCILRTVYNC